MKKWISVIILLIIIVIVGILFSVLSQPSKEKLSKDFKEQAITKLLGRKAKLDVAPEKTGNVEYKGKYISFSYPAKAEIYTIKDPGFASSSALLENFSFDIRSPRLIFNMAILKNNGKAKSVDDNPGVKLRQNAPFTYKETLVTIDGVYGKVYARRDEEPEKTGFFLHNDMMYSLSVTGTVFEDVQSLFDSLVKSITFGVSL